MDTAEVSVLESAVSLVTTLGSRLARFSLDAHRDTLSQSGQGCDEPGTQALPGVILPRIVDGESSIGTSSYSSNELFVDLATFVCPFR